LGLSYDLSGRGTTFLRGGVGLFAGRPAYIWFREAFFNTGSQQLSLVCQGNDVPAFTLDAARQPTQCAGLQDATPVITYFSPDFRFPRSLKLTVGADQRLPWGVVGTVDLLYARGVSQFVERDANLLPPMGIAVGEGGRALYGAIDPATGITEPNRRDPTFGPVIEMFSRSGDRAWSLAFQLQKRFSRGTELDAAYTYTDGRDRQSTPADGAFDNLSASPLDGTWEHPNLRSSIYSRPHKVALTGTFDLPLKVHLGLSYLAFSGDPLTYVVLGDANGDGVPNDPVYLPKAAGDITLADPTDYPRLDSLIQVQPCLRRQRGHLMERNSCRQPWFSELDARLTKVLPTARGQSLELSVDCFNLLNLLDRSWGLARFISGDGFAQTRLLQLDGYDDALGRGIYHLLRPGLREVDQARSRWRLRLSARYTF
jgi:TonB dependent receptor.